MDGGILSQDEINALLGGMAAEAEAPAAEAPADTASAPATGGDFQLTDMEKDAIGEVANISMGTSATTLFSLVNQKVNITTPVVSLSNWGELIAGNQRPCVFIQIKYTVGLDGSNILILKEDDVKIITDLMMGGDGTNTDGELSELHLSAISEAMNQMMGSSATSLSQMLGKMIDISPPVANLVDVQSETLEGSDVANFLAGTFVQIAFRMQIGELVDSTILQLYPIDFAKEVIDTFMGGGISASSEPEPAPAAAPTPPPAAAPEPAAYTPPPAAAPMQGQPAAAAPPAMDPNAAPYPYPPYPYPPYPYPTAPQGMNYQPAQFESFQGNLGAIPSAENIDLIQDVPLEVTVELGRTKKTISEILDFSPGTIIELDRIAGEPIDVLVNGKFVAKGEVVVIEESFGIRVTEIIK
ncbi:MAG: flagellar motor switch phosphatase FliY [Lachnospiraceae bacterium]|nr:flagellar motor switch phosphatase FliY [Lachnospiraceae bacterium]